MNLPEPIVYAISDDGISPHRLWDYGDGALLDTEVKRLGGTTAKMALYSESQVRETFEPVLREAQVAMIAGWCDMVVKSCMNIERLLSQENPIPSTPT